MSIFSELRNHCLIRELQREINTDVLLFGFDGFTYFGSLQGIDDCRVAILNPARESNYNNVEILTTGGEVHEVEFARVDLWQVVAKGTSIKNYPFGSCSGSGTSSGPGIAAYERGGTEGGGERELVELVDSERQESRDLKCLLERMIGEDIVITTLGGFLFEGVLSDLDDDLAILKVDEIFVPGTSSSIAGDDVGTVVINLEALTSVSKAVRC